MGRGFDPSDNWIPAQLKKPVREAIDAGWTPGKNRIKAGGWFIYSPKGSEKFYIPITCKNPDEVAKKLRALVSKAYLSEPNAFEPDQPPGVVNHQVHLSDSAIMKGAVIVPGPVPHIRCPVCDDEFEGWEAFAGHQDECEKAASAAKQEQVVPEEGDEADRPSEGVPQDATDSTEPVHSGIIGTKEETPLATESTTPTPKPGPKQGVKQELKPEPTRNPETGRKTGYKWTQVNGRGNPLHEIVYEAVRMNRRFSAETDSKYALRLSDYIEGEGLLGKLPNADPDVQAAYVLGQIRELLGGGQAQGSEEDAQTIQQLEESVTQKTEEIATLNKKVGDLRGVLSTLSDLAKETDK